MYPLSIYRCNFHEEKCSSNLQKCHKHDPTTSLSPIFEIFYCNTTQITFASFYRYTVLHNRFSILQLRGALSHFQFMATTNHATAKSLLHFIYPELSLLQGELLGILNLSQECFPTAKVTTILVYEALEISGLINTTYFKHY